MKIFDKRPLCLILCIWLGGFVFSSIGYQLPIALLSLVGILLSLILRGIGRIRGMTLLLSLTLLFSSVFSYVYFGKWFCAYERFENEVNIHGVVSTYTQSDYYDRFYIKTDDIEGEKFTDYTLILDIPRDERGALRPGCEVQITGTIVGFEESDDFDARSYYFSDGINGEIESYSKLDIIEFGEPSLTHTFKELRESIQRQAILYTNKDTGVLLTALLLGERDALSSSLRLDFTRLGITHILALSGMHLSMLTMAVGGILSLLRIRKKPRTVITIIFTIAYMAFTGFSVSVVRAGVMLILASCLYLLTRGADSVTSLSVAVFVICTVTPYAIYDTALWLSAFATLGVITLSEYSGQLKKAKSLPMKFLRYLLLSLLASVFAITMTLPATISTFYGISALSPFMTIIFSILAELIMYLGTVVLLLGGIFPFLGTPLIWLCDATKWLAAEMSSLDYIYASTGHILITVSALILFTVFILFLVLNIKHKNLAVLVISLLFCVVISESVYFSYKDTNEELAVYFTNENSDSFLIKSEGECAFISSATYSKNLAYSDMTWLYEYNVTKIDKYILTHYAYSITDSIDVLIRSFLIDEIYLPSPRNDDERQILKKIESHLSELRCEVVLYSPYEIVRTGNTSMRLLFSMPYGEGTSTNAMFLELSDVYCTYLSSGMLELDESALASTKNFMGVSDAHIYGVHGKKYKDKHFIVNKIYYLDTLVLNKVYLTPDSFEQYEKDGCEIYANPSSVDLYRDITR